MEERSFVRGALARLGKRAGTPTPQAGGVGSGQRKRLPSRSTVPTDDPAWNRNEYTEEIRHGPDGGVTPGTVHETYGAGQPGRLSGRKIRLRGPASRGLQGRPLSK